MCYAEIMLNDKQNGLSDDEERSCDSRSLGSGGGANRRRALLESNTNGVMPDTHDTTYRYFFIILYKNAIICV